MGAVVVNGRILCLLQIGPCKLSLGWIYIYISIYKKINIWTEWEGEGGDSASTHERVEGGRAEAGTGRSSGSLWAECSSGGGGSFQLDQKERRRAVDEK